MTPQEQVLQSIFSAKPNDSEITAIKEWFTGTGNQKGYYENTGIFSSLFDLHLHNDESNENRPIIKIQGINQNTTFTEDLQEIFQSIGQNKRDVIYIRRRPVELGQRENHWVVFYFFVDKNRKKNLLFIDTQNPNIGQQNKFQKDIESFKTEQDFNVCVLDISIQKGDNLCGLIASEITRILYDNHRLVKENLSQCPTQDGGKVELSNPLLGNELKKLTNSYEKEDFVNYDGKDEKFCAADIRAAHFATALAIGQVDINNKMFDRTYSLETQNPEDLVRKIRSAFIGNPNSTELFKKIVLKDETTSKANPDLGYSSGSEPSSPQLERNHLLKTPQTSSGQSSDFKKEIEKKDEEIKQLRELLNKEKANLSKIAKEKNEAFDRASKKAQALEKTKQRLSESEENVKQLTQNSNARQKEIENYKQAVNNLNTQLITKDQELNDAKLKLNKVTLLTKENSLQKDEEIKRLKDLLDKKKTNLSKIAKEKSEALASASKSVQELERTKQQLSESEENVKQLTQNSDARQKEIENHKRTVDNLNAQLTTKDQELNDAKLKLNEVTLLTEENARLRAQSQDLNNKNKKFSEASAQGRQQSNYASVAFMVAGTFAVVASLTMPYLAVCITFAIAALVSLMIGSCCLHKANTILSNAEVNQITISADPTAAQKFPYD